LGLSYRGDNHLRPGEGLVLSAHLQNDRKTELHCPPLHKKKQKALRETKKRKKKRIEGRRKEKKNAEKKREKRKKKQKKRGVT